MRLGRLEEALAAYRQAVTIRENLLKNDATNVATQRDLMFVHSHIGDLLGNPNLPNMGDAKGAVQAYGRMLEIARRIHGADPADLRARSDYAIALTRVAAVLPVEDAQSRLRTLRQAIDLQNEVARANPDDLSNRTDIAINHNFLGDAYLTAGDEGNALQSFREGLKLAESMSSSVTPTLARGTVMMYRKSSELMIRNGERSAAIDAGENALRLVDPAGPTAKNWPDASRKVLSALAASSMGHIFAALAKSAQRRPSDREDARRWLGKGLLEYRALEGGPVLTGNVRREMRAVESELETMK